MPAPRPKENKPQLFTAHSRAAQAIFCQLTLKAGGTLCMPDLPEQRLKAERGVQHLPVHHQQHFSPISAASTSKIPLIFKDFLHGKSM